jgi:hypothetical protein
MISGPWAEMRHEPWKLLAKDIEGAIAVRIALNDLWKLRDLKTRLPQQTSEDSFDLIAIDRADGTDATIAIEDLLPQIPGIAPEPMLMNAVVATE